MPLENENSATSPQQTAPRKESFWGELFRFAIIALVIVVPIRFWVAQPFIVSGASMEPTFDDGQYLIVDELSYHLRVPERGEVVIFHYPRDPSKFFIKRVIGLPEETISIRDGKVTVKNAEHPDGFSLDEPYVKLRSAVTLDRTLGEKEYFVMGDNRPASSDSRSWGPVTEDKMVGRAFLRLYPINVISVLPGSHTEVQN